VTDSKALVDKLWNYCNVLRDDGLSYGDYVEQLTGALSAVDLAWENWSEDRAVLTIAAECSIDPELVRVAAQVGGAL
jgi:hypothetical protein